MTVILVAPIRSAIRTSDVRNSAKMSPVGWGALGQWGEDVARIEPLAGRITNDVWSVGVHGHLAVGRIGARSDVAWETELLQVDLDLVLPHNAAGLDDEAHDIAAQASAAWEAAVCWDDEYAIKRLAEVRAI